VAVGGGTGAGDLGVDPGTAPLGMLGGFEDHDRAALAEDEAVPRLVERPGRPLGLVVAPGKCHHRAERRHRQPVDGCLGTAHDGDVGLARTDDLEAVPDRLVARGACRHRCLDGRPCADVEADPGGATVRHDHRNGVRRHVPRPFGLQDVVDVEHADETADARRDRDGDAFARDTGIVEAGILPRLTGGDESELFVPVELARLHPRDDLGGVHRRGGGYPGG
jgi:hypothetical protein